MKNRAKLWSGGKFMKKVMPIHALVSTLSILALLFLGGCGETEPKKVVEEPLLDLDAEKKRYKDDLAKAKARIIRVYEREIKEAENAKLVNSTKLLKSELAAIKAEPKKNQAASGDLSQLLGTLTSSLGENSDNANLDQLKPLLGMLGQLQNSSQGSGGDASNIDIGALMGIIGQLQGGASGNSQNQGNQNMSNVMGLLGQVLNASASASSSSGGRKGSSNDIFGMFNEFNQINASALNSTQRTNKIMRNRTRAMMRRLLSSIHNSKLCQGKEYYPEPFSIKNGIRTSNYTLGGNYLMNNQLIKEDAAQKELEQFSRYKGKHPVDPREGYFLFVGVDAEGKPKKLKDPETKVLIEVYDWRTKGDRRVAVMYGDSRVEYIPTPLTSPEDTDILKLLNE